MTEADLQPTLIRGVELQWAFTGLRVEWHRDEDAPYRLFDPCGPVKKCRSLGETIRAILEYRRDSIPLTPHEYALIYTLQEIP